MILINTTSKNRSTGTVLARDGRKHTVAIDGGSTVQADSYISYNPGRRVTLVAGVIVGTAGVAPSLINYQQ